jgi:hypothetical protein
MQDLKDLVVDKITAELGRDKIDYQVLDALTRLLDQVKWQLT